MFKSRITMVLIMASGILFQACGGGQSQKTENPEKAAGTAVTEKEKPTDYDPKRGEGNYTSANVNLGPLDPAKANEGEKVATTKCTSCHKLTDEKLVGPGWKGVTTRHEPFWILNFITNPDPMIDKDPVVQAQLELCLVRMPNQSLSDVEARQILEFMRKNDGVK